MAALRIKDVWKHYGTVPVLKGIDLEIDSGEFAILVGPSGCGKSTLLNIIAGLDTASQGSIEIGGRADERRGGEGPQHRHGVPVLRAVPVDDGAAEHDVRHGMQAGAETQQIETSTGSRSCCRSRRCWTASRRNCPADSASVSPWAERWCAIHCCSCSTNRCRIWMRSCAWRCVWRSSGCISARLDHRLRDARSDRGDDAWPHASR